MKDHHEGRKKIGKFEPHEEPDTELLADKDESPGKKKVSAVMVILAAAVFLGIVFISDYIELKFGKTLNILSLCVIAVILLLLYFKDEIKHRFTENNSKQDGINDKK